MCIVYTASTVIVRPTSDTVPLTECNAAYDRPIQEVCWPVTVSRFMYQRRVFLVAHPSVLIVSPWQPKVYSKTVVLSVLSRPFDNRLHLGVEVQRFSQCRCWHRSYYTTKFWYTTLHLTWSKVTCKTFWRAFVLSYGRVTRSVLVWLWKVHSYQLSYPCRRRRVSKTSCGIF